MLLKSIFATALIFWLFAFPSTAQICIPTITLQNGVAVCILPLDTDGDGNADTWGARVRLSDLVVAARNHCDARPLRFGMRKAGQGTGMPKDTMLTFECTELGRKDIEVWVRNAQGRMNLSITFVDVQENFGYCNASPLPSALCGPDVLAPEIVLFNGFATGVRVEGSNPPSATLHASWLVKSVYDNCGGPYEYRIRKAGNGTGAPLDTEVTFGCNELGKQNLEVWVGDASGNWAFCVTFVEVQDNVFPSICNNPPGPIPTGCSPDETSPILVVKSGLAQSIAWPDGGKKTRVYAEDFVVFAADACSPITEIRMRKAGQGTGVPPAGQTDLLFPCSELGKQNVEIWLLDASGNWTMALTFVEVQDTTGNC